ncbi:hypothetical protein PHMEG_00033990 [Phytophthora megakarya]|uniref:Uncharacterized protein n=1 Tax=Phytophthora megakarya TaxID=4795 RepID=A0A225USI2_9STRA|nr:hypothetical protein PHMEG_00033990 [Phytophthora megakarya]
MSSNDPSEVTFEKVKSNGAVSTFRDGDWTDWLEWLLRLSECYVFTGYAADDEEGQVLFVEDIQVQLFDEDLQQSNDSVTEDSILQSTTVALVALLRLTEAHCPDGTRGKTRDISVREYTRSFRKLGRILSYISDNEAIPTSDEVRMDKSGTPMNWQIQSYRVSRSWEYTVLLHQFELIEPNEQEEVFRTGSREPRTRTGRNAQQEQK